MKIDSDMDGVLDEVLEMLSPDKDEFINRRIANRNFAKIVFWLCVQSRKQEYISARELTNFIKLDLSRVYKILNDLSINGFLNKKMPVSNLAEYWFAKNEMGAVAIANYFEKAKRTLGINLKVTLDRKEVKA